MAASYTTIYLDDDLKGAALKAIKDENDEGANTNMSHYAKRLIRRDLKERGYLK